MADEFWKRSPVTGRKYDYFSKDVVHLVNLAQCDYYMNECGVMPLDIMLTDDRKRPGKKIVLFCFSNIYLLFIAPNGFSLSPVTTG